MDEARKLLPKLSDFPDVRDERQHLVQCLLDYIRYLEDDNTTALDMGIDTRKLLVEIANEIGDIADVLAPDTPEVKEILEEFDYYDELE
jgi:hypothetical protein